MRRFLPLLLINFFFIAAKAQNHGVVKGIVLDSLTQLPIQYATVSVLRVKDTSLISYTVTDKNGAFTLRNLREEQSRLLITHVGHQGLHVSLDFKKGQLIDLGKLYLTNKTLAEVIVKGERIPVVIKKDTIEFDAEAFKTRPNALVEDLLKKLPGVQVDAAGGITVNGKDVSKIKVNGKTFFANDPTIATRNLDASMISKVQIYDDRDDDPDHLVPDYEVKKILNLKFKKAFARGFVTTVSAGAGTQDRYTGSAFLVKYEDSLQISARVNTDNLNNTNSFAEGIGGLNGRLFGSTGLSKATNGNFDLTKDISKKFKLHVEYRFSNRINDNSSDSRVQQNIRDTVFNTLTQNQQHQTTNSQNFHAETEWHPDTLTIIKFVPDIGYDYSANNSQGTGVSSNTWVPLLNTTVNNENGSNNAFSYQHNLSYYRKLNKKGASLTLANSIGVHTGDSRDITYNGLVSYVAALQSDTLRRLAKNSTNDVSGVLNVAYHYPITKKLSLDMVVIALHDQNKGERLTYDEDLKTGLYTLFLQNQSNDLVRSLWGENATPQLTYNFAGDISIRAGITAQTQQIENHFNSYTADLNQNFFYLLPSAQLHVKGFTVSYGEQVVQPSINDLQPITIVYSPLYTFTGNPNLKPSYLHHLNFSYQHFNMAGINTFLYSNVTIEKNTVVNDETISAGGATTTTPINRNGRFNVDFSANLNRNFKTEGKWQFNIQTAISASAAHNFFIVNGQNGYQNTQSMMINPNVNITWNDLVTFTPSYRLSYIITQYQFVNYPRNNYVSQRTGLLVDISLPENFRWRADYSYNYDPAVAPGFKRSANLLDFSVSKRIQKDGKGEIGLTCFDLLNQNVSQAHRVAANTITDMQNLVMKRYLLVTYTYHFKKFK